jgi:hypothetical protein
MQSARPMRTLPAISALLGATLLLGTAACSDGTATTEEDLTSVRARSRELRFDGLVYVSPTASEAQILDTVHKQTKSMFGPLRTRDISVNNRELKGVDPKTFVKREVTVVDTSKPSDPGTKMLEVRYTYVDDAVVPTSMSTRSTLSTAMLSPAWSSQTKRILTECTPNDKDARDFESDIWYVFEPSLSQCQSAIKKEQELVNAARAALKEPTSQVALAETKRLYLPVTVQLGADKTNDKNSWPEYDKLWAGGVEPGALVISLLNGTIDHDHAGGGLYEDSGYAEWLDSLNQIFEEHPELTLASVESGVDIASVTLSTGKVVKDLGFDDFIQWSQGYLPSGLTSAEKKELQTIVSDRISDTWITFELPVKVKIGRQATKPFTIKLKTYFGEASSTTPYKKAIKTSDVFLYNGHSMIGYGPLDPKNFTASDFPSTYQILFIDSCVSYNYYEADYFPLKSGGTKTLDLVTNAVESPAWRSGYALGQFINLLVSGTQPTWLDLLESAEATGSGLRVVDGELDNTYSPKSRKITVTFP